MKATTYLPLGLGVVVGIIAIKQVVDVVNNAQGASQAGLTKCAVAKLDIEFAEEIMPERLELREWPKDSISEQNCIESIEDLEGRVTNMFIPKDVPIYPTMLAPPGTPPGIQSRIQPGYRAVSVAIDEIKGVAFQVKPGDHVDVVALLKRPQVGGRGVLTISRVILQNVEIAAVGRTLDASKNDAKGKAANKTVARSVTLLLTPEEVTKLHFAQESGGRISLALRGNSDADEDAVASSTNADLLGEAYSEIEESPMEDLATPAVDPQPAPPPAPAPVLVAAPVEPPVRVMVVSGKETSFVDYRALGPNQWEVVSGGFEERTPPPPPGPKMQPEPQIETPPAPRGVVPQEDTMDFEEGDALNYGEGYESADE